MLYICMLIYKVIVYATLICACHGLFIDSLINQRPFQTEEFMSFRFRLKDHNLNVGLARIWKKWP
jgi:hypothetical protein